MQERPLGQSGLRVSVLSLGCNRIGEDRETDAHWIGLLHRAADLGVTLLDTAENYAKSRSEELIGRALGSRPGITIATKCSGRIAGEDEETKNFSPERIAGSVEGSLRRLRRECIDVYQLHSPSLAALQKMEWLEALQKLKRAGKIRLLAVSLDRIEDGIWLLDHAPVDAFQMIYNLLLPEAEEVLLPRCRAAGVGVLARMPLQRGVLTGKFHAGQPVSPGHRALLERDRLAGLIERAESFRGMAARRAGGMPELAVQYCLANPAVSCLIPGARSIAQLEENLLHGDAPPLAPAEAEEIRRIQTGAAGSPP
jgi:aryl-alcohol dehydrogenase-like predicted oxidoreductase